MALHILDSGLLRTFEVLNAQHQNFGVLEARLDVRANLADSGLTIAIFRPRPVMSKSSGCPSWLAFFPGSQREPVGVVAVCSMDRTIHTFAGLSNAMWVGNWVGIYRQ